MKSIFSSGKIEKVQTEVEDLQKKNILKELQHFHDNSLVAFYACDSQGRIIYYNPAAARLWGVEPVLGETFWCGSWKTFHPNGQPMEREECPMAKAIGNEDPLIKQEIYIERPDGSIKNLLAFPQRIFDENQNIIGAYCSLVDVTDQQSGQIKQSTLSAIVESSDDAIISKDLTGKIISWNRSAQRIFGYTEEEVLGKHITILIPEYLLEEETQILSKIRQGRRVDHFETIRKAKNGKEIPLSITVSPLRNFKGKVVGASKIARDISDRIKVEEKQAMLSAIVESSDDAIISKDLNGIIRSWNPGAQRIFGYSEKEVVGKSITILIPKERLQEEAKILSKIRNGESLDHFETVRRTKSGKEIPISLSVSPIKDSKNTIIGASKIARDITEQVRAQEEIKRYTENLEILNSIGKSISENLDVQAVLQRVTDATTKLTGAQFGAFFYNHINEEGRAMMLYNLSGAPREAFEKFGMPRHTDVFRPTFTGEGPIRVDDITKDPRYGKNFPLSGMPLGHLPVVSYLAVPVISKSGLVIGGLLFGHPESGVFKHEHEEMVVNIAAQAAISLDNSKLFEQVKSLSDKKDEFIALASHELKTPLTTIKGYLQVLEKKEKDQMTALFIDKALNQVNKLNTLVEDLLNMSRIEAGKLDFTLEDFDLREMVLEIIETFSYSYSTHQILFDLGVGSAMVHGDRQRIEQAVINLVTNAIKYSPEADRIYLKIEVHKDRVVVKVKDQGIGLSEEQQKQLFTRFYRAENTKGISGLGIGLYLTKQIIDRHKGEISLSSTLGEGSEFSFYLPLKNE
ncbi:PAS domain S-box protein [Antarcticibacterium sp. 1MA-6-2]|uniref:PAS domain S-box protein n=1 Tax=Antarcticibacterium sp. 1MA-6-2 TaxID=2908210 RepID=UPI001F34E81A|nr:PAS domain S-box protein [Antarcticibacterium sp. 1MA-6-2]UJH90755.1 PAS domain S-box protein [Antarcticibacterium sp. 1MA-6-2]